MLKQPVFRAPASTSSSRLGVIFFSGSGSLTPRWEMGTPVVGSGSRGGNKVGSRSGSRVRVGWMKSWSHSRSKGG